MSQRPGEYDPDGADQPRYGQPTPPGGPTQGGPTHGGYGQAGWGQGTGTQGGYGQGGYVPSASGYEAASSTYRGPRPTNALAIVSLVTSIIGIGIVGIVTGHIARRQIRRTGEAGDGLALAGLIIGYVITVIEVLLFLAFIGLFIVGASQGVGMGTGLG